MTRNVNYGKNYNPNTTRIVYTNNIFIEHPHITSSASLAKLKQQLQTQDYDFQENNRLLQDLKDGKINKKIIRKIFLKRWKRLYGKLFCYICGRDDLKEKGPTNRKKGGLQENIATLDHKVAVVNGGLKYAFRNMICLCGICNNKKGDSHLHNFKTHKMIQKF